MHPLRSTLFRLLDFFRCELRTTENIKMKTLFTSQVHNYSNFHEFSVLFTSRTFSHHHISECTNILFSFSLFIFFISLISMFRFYSCVFFLFLPLLLFSTPPARLFFLFFSNSAYTFVPLYFTHCAGESMPSINTICF